MENLQDVLTLAATVVEYFFFAYLAVAFMVYSLESPYLDQQPNLAGVPSAATRSPSVAAGPYKVWEPTVTSGASVAGTA